MVDPRRQTILVIGPMPPPLSGTNISFQIFCETVSRDSNKLHLNVIDSSPPHLGSTRLFTLSHLATAVRVLPRSRIVDTSRSFRDRHVRLENVVRHTHGPQGEHAHTDVAFTTWLNFQFAAEQAKAIQKALISKLPQHDDELEKNYAELEKDLLDLDSRMKRVVGENAKRPLVASHPVYQYLAKRYNLNLRSPHWEPDTFPASRQWLALKTLLKKHPARWMMWEGKPATRSVESLRAMGVGSVVFRPAGNVPASGDFLSVMRQNIENLKPVFK